MPAIVSVILGAILLFFGRALYWVFVAIAGFLVGMMLAEQLLADQPEWTRFVAALAAGVIGAVVGIVAQRLAFAIGGFYAGGYIALNLAAHLSRLDNNATVWFIVGGVIGAIVAAIIMDWAIIVLSSLAGAVAILAPFQEVDPTARTLLFVVLTAVGIAGQGRRLMRPVAVPMEAPR